MIPGYPANVTPVAAMALIGGLYLNRKALAFLVPLVAVFASDFILNNTINRGFFSDTSGLIIFDSYMFWTYGAFLLTVVLGIALTKSKSATKIIAGGLGASVLFFILSNLGAWVSMPMYTKDLSGLATCFAAAVPFFRNTIMSNLLFATLFIGSIEYMKNHRTAGQLAR